MTVVRQLLGHDTAETAFMVLNYPWGFRMKTKRRYWIETTKRGQRAIYQTMDPKTGRWCKPKKGTYSDIMVMYLDEVEHVQFDGGQFSAFVKQCLGAAEFEQHGECAIGNTKVGPQRAEEAEKLFAKVDTRSSALMRLTSAVAHAHHVPQES